MADDDGVEEGRGVGPLDQRGGTFADGPLQKAPDSICGCRTDFAATDHGGAMSPCDLPAIKAELATLDRQLKNQLAGSGIKVRGSILR